MILWRPTQETSRVLSQIGYTKTTIESALPEFSILSEGEDCLFSKTDKDFVLFLRCYNSKASRSIEEKLITFNDWSPSSYDVSQLVDEGYWELLIYEQLVYFKAQYQSTRLIRWHFGLFRYFLRKTRPITSCPIDEWEVPNWLSRVIKCDFQLNHTELNFIKDDFKKSCYRRGVPSRSICRYYYNYMKKHYEKNSESAVA